MSEQDEYTFDKFEKGLLVVVVFCAVGLILLVPFMKESTPDRNKTQQEQVRRQSG